MANPSHLTRGAWIEIPAKFNDLLLSESRTSHEVRGLKSALRSISIARSVSHLTRGAWIEILDLPTGHVVRVKSHLTRGAWIEIGKTISM